VWKYSARYLQGLECRNDTFAIDWKLRRGEGGERLFAGILHPLKDLF
jgi:hypothetical protein